MDDPGDGNVSEKDRLRRVGHHRSIRLHASGSYAKRRLFGVSKGFFKCFLYLVLTGLLAFFAGRLLSRHHFNAGAFPFRCFGWEQKLHRLLRVHDWQNRVPDMSRITHRLFPGLMPQKKLTTQNRSDIPLMIQETCIAGLIHAVLCLTGLACLRLWPGAGGIIITAVYIIFGNIPFIIIQRYNRPRLMKLLAAQRRRKEGGHA